LRPRVGLRLPSERGEVVAIDGFDRRIRRREIVGLIGEAGCGKSTTALALLGLVRPPGRFDGGRIRFLGREILGLPDREMREIRGREISLIVQNPQRALNPRLRIGNQIANVYLAHHRVSDDVALEHAVEMVALVGINDPRRV
jgi:ABC-type dipeptide/oligopeptide/nickel transport system ATPase component